MACRLIGAKPLSQKVMTPLGTNFNETIIETSHFFFDEIVLKVIISNFAATMYRLKWVNMDIALIHTYNMFDSANEPDLIILNFLFVNPSV